MRGLKLDASELSDMMNSTLGHKHICIALVMLHFPYSYAGIICLLHFLALTTLIAYRMSSPVVSAKVVTVIKVLQYLLNIVLLCLSILGINSQSLWLHTQTCF